MSFACQKEPRRRISTGIICPAHDTGTDFCRDRHLQLTVLIIGNSDKPNTERRRRLEIIGTVAGKMNAAGYTRTDDKDAANVGIQLSYVRKVTYFVGYDYPYWWWYYPYYWAPGYWGDWLGWHYPYQVYYGYTAGSMLIEMVDLTADRQSNRKLPVIWDSFIGGLLTSSHKVNMQRTLDAVNQAFMQSPYLETNSVNR